MILKLKASSKITKVNSINSNDRKYYLINNNFYMFGKITQYVRKWLNRIRFEDNRALQTHSQNKIEILQTPKEVQDRFIAYQQAKSVMEKQRMARIDQILGTKTYYHQTKIFQQRLDSDHLMDVSDLKRKHAPPSRQNLKWQNPQSQQFYKIKNKRKFYKNMRLLRQYPKHPNQIQNMQDQTQQEVLNFLAKQTLFTTLSMKSVDLSAKSLQTQSIQNLLRQLQSRRFTRLYAYFSTQHSSSLFRIPQAKYTADLITKIDKLKQLEADIDPIISLEEIYEVIKQYYHDERVSQYLKEVENGRIQYVVSGFQTSSNEEKIVFWVDLLGSKKEYAFFFKAMKQNQGKLSKHVIYNCKAPAIFSSNGQYLYLIRRSQQGGFIQLIQKQLSDFSKQPKIIYKCQGYEEMQIFKDKNNNFIFIRITQIGSKYKQKIFILDEKSQSQQTQEGSNGNNTNDKFKLIQLTDINLQQKNSNTNNKEQQKNNQLQKTQCRHQIQICSKGLIIVKLYSTKGQYLKYGPNIQYSTKVELIPYKQHIQIMHETNEKIGLQLPGYTNSSSNLTKISVHELQLNKRKLIYECSNQEFIIQTSVRSTHILLNMSSKSIYNKTKLYLLPFSQASNPHSLVFQAQKLQFMNFGYDYNSQTSYFKLKKNITEHYYYYTIWKREISQVKNDRIYEEQIQVNQNIKINIMCLDRYINLQKTRGKQIQLPVVLWLDDGKITNDQSSLKRLLEKGIMIVCLDCRGTYQQDLIKFYQGTGQNYQNLLKDIEIAIEYIGNNFTTDISLYAKGNFMAFIGLLINLKHPFLFISTVLHNGIYDLNDWTILSRNQQFFGSFITREQFQEKTKFWSFADPLKFRWKIPFRQQRQEAKTQIIQNENQENYLLKIGTLQNIVFSSDKNNRLHSRKIIHKLRQNPYFTYGDVYLKEHDFENKVDLLNLAYIFLKIRNKLQSTNGGEDQFVLTENQTEDLNNKRKDVNELI